MLKAFMQNSVSENASSAIDTKGILLSSWLEVLGRGHSSEKFNPLFLNAE